MKKYKVFFAIAIILMIALTACDVSSNSEAPTAQFEAPAVYVAPTLEGFEKYSTTTQPDEYILPIIDLVANSSPSGSSGNCSSGRDQNKIWVNLKNVKSISIELVAMVGTQQVPVQYNGDFVRNQYDLGSDFILVDISPSPISINGQPFIKLLCYEASIGFMHIQYGEYIENGLYYFLLQEEAGRFNDGYLHFLPSKIDFISTDVISATGLDPVDRRP